ncbi:MAG TPA: thioredoxin domain-containing protein [Rhabdochlamydiaceae bacterium]|nr:thioredoxin domain-containing protein [Rhabdochlamydiaceae bacterium]
MKNQKLSIPIAIIFAGLLIALGLYFTGNRGTPVVQTAQVNQSNIVVRPVSPTEHILGNIYAPIKIIDYSDTECPYCKQFHQTLKQIYATYSASGTVAWVYRDFPLDIHPKARKEAEALECAADLGGNDAFWKYLDQIFAITPSNDGLDPAELPLIAQYVGLDVTAFNNCLSSGKEAAKVQADVDDGIKAGAQGTPYTVFVTPNGNIANPDGAIPYSAVQNYIEVILKNL